MNNWKCVYVCVYLHMEMDFVCGFCLCQEKTWSGCSVVQSVADI